MSEFERKAVTFFEIDVDYCGNTYGISPCAAALGTTGVRNATTLWARARTA